VEHLHAHQRLRMVLQDHHREPVGQPLDMGMQVPGGGKPESEEAKQDRERAPARGSSGKGRHGILPETGGESTPKGASCRQEALVSGIPNLSRIVAMTSSKSRLATTSITLQ